MPTYNIQLGVQADPVSQSYLTVGRVDLKFPDDITQATIGPNTTVELDFPQMSPPYTLERMSVFVKSDHTEIVAAQTH